MSETWRCFKFQLRILQIETIIIILFLIKFNIDLNRSNLVLQLAHLDDTNSRLLLADFWFLLSLCTDIFGAFS